MKASIWGLAVLMMAATRAYRIKYNDCTKPKRVSEMNVKEQCNQVNETPTDQRKTYTILQKRRHLKMEGYKCRVVKSIFTIYCGAFGHNKIMRIPKIEIVEPTTPHMCESMITTSRYTSLEGTTHEVRLGQETVFSVSELGVIHVEDNAITCEGETLKINGHIVKDVLRMAQYRVILDREEYIVEGKRVEALTDHVRLPAGCALEVRGCVTNEQTYVWTEPTNTCPYQKIRTGNFNQEGKWLVDHDLKIVLTIEDHSKTPTSCTPTTVYYTEYNSIFLTEATDFEQVTEVDITLFTKTSDDYVLYTSERASRHLKEFYNHEMCRQKYTRDNHDIINLGEVMAKRNGDVLYIFQCEEKVGKVLSSDVCYDKIPLDDGKTFVDPVTRIASKFRAVRDCNTHFPQLIETLDGWISINPKLKQVTPPGARPLNQVDDDSHEDLSKGGLYTPEEIASWENLIQWQSFHDSLTQHISYGVCVKENECYPNTETRQGVPRYDLNRLMEQVVEEASIWGHWKKIVNEYGAYLSLIVLIKWTAELIVITTLTIITYTKDGVKASIALLYTTCCTSMHRARKVRVRSEKLRNYPSAPDDDAETPLSVVKRI